MYDKPGPIDQLVHLYVDGGITRRDLVRRVARKTGGVAAAMGVLDAFMAAFNDLLLNDESNRTAADFVREKIRGIVKDPKTAELLSLKGDTRGQRDQVINDLLKVHTRFTARIGEYRFLLNMTEKFFENLNQVHRNIKYIPTKNLGSGFTKH